jgi:hypothetical protein
VVTGTGVTSEWRGTSASLRGSSHGAEGVNQDAVRIEELASGPGGSTWVAAVSDGHGGPRYVRSETGARLAVSVAVATVADLLVGGHPFDHTLLPTATAVIVDGWRAAVLAHVAEHPFTDDEAARGGAAVVRDPVVAYGATLLVAAVGDPGVLLAQVGDGDALVRTHGFAVRPVPGDGRLVANETTSLCLDSAAEDFRYADLPASAEVDLVLLSSDGYGNSFAAQDWWHGLVDDLAWYVDVHGFEAFATHLPDWLAESALVGGDDVTAAVLTRPLDVPVPTTPVVDTAPAQALAPTPAPPDGRTRRPPARHRRRVLLVALAVAAVVAAAVLAGARLLSGTGSTPDDVTPSPTVPASSPPSDSSSPGDGEDSPRDRPPAQPGPGGNGENGLPDRPPDGGTKDGGQPKP